MICPDVNLLLYAVHEDYPQHSRAKAWWDSALSAAEPVALLHVVVMGFIRLSTHPKIFSNPPTLEETIGVVERWLARPQVRWVSPGRAHWALFKHNLREAGVAGNLTTDAHIAAVAAEYGLVVHTSDADFGRFSGIKVVNPLKSV